MIEKHITINRNSGGVDSSFSMEPGEFADLVHQGKLASLALGSSEWEIQPSEYESRRLRRSLYIVSDVKSGDEVSRENLRAIRPGEGASPKHLESWLGRKYKEDYKAGTPMRAELLE